MKSKKNEDALNSFKKNFKEIDLDKTSQLIKSISESLFLTKKEHALFLNSVKKWLLSQNILLD